MGPTFLLDEHLRGHLWRVIRRHNRLGAYPLDVTRVGEPPDLPCGTSDPDILIWAERAGRIVLSEDWTTMRAHFQAHLAAGHHSPGLFLVRPQVLYVDVVDYLAVVAYASAADEWVDSWRAIP